MDAFSEEEKNPWGLVIFYSEFIADFCIRNDDLSHELDFFPPIPYTTSEPSLVW